MRLILLLLLISSPVLASESQQTHGELPACPSRAQSAAAGEADLPAAATTSTPALKSASDDNASSATAARPRQRSRGAAWHSFLPGMFK